jgi:hypothetical protein
MYYGDHPPPHFHARYGDEEAKVENRAIALNDMVKVTAVEPLAALSIRVTPLVASTTLAARPSRRFFSDGVACGRGQDEVLVKSEEIDGGTCPVG